MSVRQTECCLFGASPDTGNLGVSALCFATLTGILSRDPSVCVTVFDYGKKGRRAEIEIGGCARSYLRCGAFDTRRYYRAESLWNIRMSCRLGGLANPGANAILQSDAVLDISGGDSFTDLYGARRFWSVTLPKLIAIEANRPLVLLPQTYGPFSSPRIRRAAEAVVRRSAAAWARDDRSYDELQSLLGHDFDPERHRSGVDVAFALPARCPRTPLGHLGRWLDDRTRPLVGINVSGLILNDPDGSKNRFGLKADYRQVISELLSRLLDKTDARVVLIPHVVTPPGHYESDLEASERIKSAINGAQQQRVTVAPAFDDPRDVKWLIAQMDWFCGTRMHSTIAALSSGVPCAAVAYSVKTAGVFNSCQQGDQVVDPRSFSTGDVVDRLWECWINRSSASESLQRALPNVLARAEVPFEDIWQGLPLRRSQREIR